MHSPDTGLTDALSGALTEPNHGAEAVTYP